MDPMLNKGLSEKKTLVPKHYRKIILERLFKEKVRIRIEAYEAKLTPYITRRQAEYDLNTLVKTCRLGATKGAFYCLLKNRPRYKKKIQ